MTSSPRLHQAVTFSQAVENSPSLARLAGLVQESSDRLRAVESLIPEALRPAIQAGPIEDGVWCLLVSSNAAAAKVRQLLPLLLTRLTDKGWKVTSIRLKILISRK
ncbi:DciA family protein [Polaromonas sp. YR568]|uniref:DciA family protein n=1 Tax=Polaromonas sp. YR568 TaxID=1855301 RepID=UPI0031379B51